MSKSAAHRYLAALLDAGVVEMAGIGKSVKWQVASRAAVGAEPPEHVTIEALAQAVHEGLVEASQEQRAVLEDTGELVQAIAAGYRSDGEFLEAISGAGDDGPAVPDPSSDRPGLQPSPGPVAPGHRLVVLVALGWKGGQRTKPPCWRTFAASC
jgi:hypothetical protein